MTLPAIILRVLTAVGMTTKGAELDWEEFDTNLIQIYQAIAALNNIAGVNVFSLQGGYDPTATSKYPNLYNTLLDDQPQKGYSWYVKTSGTINGHAVAPGAFVFAIVNNALFDQDSNWVIIDSGFSLPDLFTAWAKTLPGYDNTKQRFLGTVGDSTDSFGLFDVGGL